MLFDEHKGDCTMRQKPRSNSQSQFGGESSGIGFNWIFNLRFEFFGLDIASKAWSSTISFVMKVLEELEVIVRQSDNKGEFSRDGDSAAIYMLSVDIMELYDA